MKTFYGTLSSMLALVVSVWAAEPKSPIDVTLDQCLSVDSNQSTMGMVQCVGEAQGEWDKELNRVYKKLMGVLSAEEKEVLKNAQRKWLEYRDLEFTFTSTLHGNMDGTIHRIENADRCLAIVRQRALDLKSYYDIRTETY